MLRLFIAEMNERLLMGEEVYFPAPGGNVGLLEALLLSCRKGEVKSILPFCTRRMIVVGGQAYHVYKL